jgi:hypothetical protein
MDEDKQLPRILIAAEGLGALGKCERVLVATFTKASVGRPQNLLALLLQCDQQPEISTAAAALGSFIGFGSADGTAHAFWSQVAVGQLRLTLSLSQKKEMHPSNRPPTYGPFFSGCS